MSISVVKRKMSVSLHLSQVHRIIKKTSREIKNMCVVIIHAIFLSFSFYGRPPLLRHDAYLVLANRNGSAYPLFPSFHIIHPKKKSPPPTRRHE